MENKQTIFIRLFNIRDEFDEPTLEQRNPQINVGHITNDIWDSVTSASHNGFKITEISLNHLQTIEEMRANRRQWPSNAQVLQNTSKYYIDIYI